MPEFGEFECDYITSRLSQVLATQRSLRNCLHAPYAGCLSRLMGLLQAAVVKFMQGVKSTLVQHLRD